MLKAVRISNRNHQLTDAQIIRVAEFGWKKMLCIGFYHCEITVGVFTY
jgi:hypothetical protein